ncbi:hypothetical protein J5226_16345 [Lysobacter sp. K5869]|uniref:hypothetical protein n=1 Tax=Lysobacter sp. K5869 TaxID=2820808 RepID=UPI001C06120F|nr:hypothetical protein [Lysobacter sp. K5869]QWP75189.1 hypothetical protein J5226_16345 [Lysobacter sp. K5869]
MNRKLHNSISALMAAGGALVLGLVVALPLPAPDAPPAPALTQFAADAPATRPIEVNLGAVKARISFDRDFLERARSRSGDVAGAVRKIEQRAQQLENTDQAGELTTIAGALAGDVADLAALANAVAPAIAPNPNAAAESAGAAEPKRKAGSAARRSRSNLVMPYFSFLSRG